jgi:hypothetical protein
LFKNRLFKVYLFYLNDRNLDFFSKETSPLLRSIIQILHHPASIVNASADKNNEDMPLAGKFPTIT